VAWSDGNSGGNPIAFQPQALRGCFMTFVLIWLGFAVAVAIAANTRGRSGVGWFFLAALISPLIAGLIVLALPSLAAQAPIGAALPFTPEAVLEGIPYRRTTSGEIEAMLPGGRALFRDLDQLSAVAKGGTIEYQKPPISLAGFPNELNGFRYRAEQNGQVIAINPAGKQACFQSWSEFWKAANQPR
jgi:hypothetical protein